MLARLCLALVACTPSFQSIGVVPGDAVIVADKESAVRYTPRVHDLTAAEVEECRRWFADRDINTDDWRYMRVQLRTVGDLATGAAHGQLIGTTIVVNWIRGEPDTVIGKLVCHEMGHRFISYHHSVMRAAGYPW